LTHPLVTQLHFARSEFQRCLAGVTTEEAVKRFEPINCLSWIVGHLAGQEHYLWVHVAQDRIISPEIYRIAGYQSAPNTPDWDAMWAEWHKITQEADKFLLNLTEAMITNHLKWPDRESLEDVGTTLLRNIYHYWFHTGEAHAVRQLLGHQKLPQFVGDMSAVKHS
jgi:hypothetical protein